MEKLVDNSTLEIANIDGRLKDDKEIRQELTTILREEFNIPEVIYKEQIQPYTGHINPFYNLSIH